MDIHVRQRFDRCRADGMYKYVFDLVSERHRSDKLHLKEIEMENPKPKSGKSLNTQSGIQTEIKGKRMNRGLVSILLHALDEEKSIGKVIDSIPQDVLRERGYEVEVIVVDGHSRDRTISIARAKGARIITQTGLGKGNAMRTAFKKANGAYVFMMDADNTYNPRFILRMLPHLESGEYDVVLGSRLRGSIESGAMPPVNMLGNKVLTSTANLLFHNGHRMSDVCTGMWGFNGGAIKRLKLNSKRFELEAEMYAKCVKRGFKIGEVPVNYKKRDTFAKLKSIRDGIRIWVRLILEKIKK